jgi:hypothetical protein
MTFCCALAGSVPARTANNAQTIAFPMISPGIANNLSPKAALEHYSKK